MPDAVRDASGSPSSSVLPALDDTSESAIAEALARLAPRPTPVELPVRERNRTTWPAGAPSDARAEPGPPLDPASLDPASLAEALRILGAPAAASSGPADATAETTRASGPIDDLDEETARRSGQLDDLDEETAQRDARLPPAGSSGEPPQALTERAPSTDHRAAHSHREVALVAQSATPPPWGAPESHGDRPTPVLPSSAPAAPLKSSPPGAAPSTQPSPAAAGEQAVDAESRDRHIVAPRHAELFREIEAQRRALSESAMRLASAQAEIERQRGDLDALRALLAARDHELAAVRASRNTTDLHPRPTSAARDDLRRIRGIGPSFAQRLRGLEIHSFAAIAAWTERDVEVVAKALGIRAGRIRRDDWVGSARALVEEGAATRST